MSSDVDIGTSVEDNKSIYLRKKYIKERKQRKKKRYEKNKYIIKGVK